MASVATKQPLRSAAELLSSVVFGAAELGIDLQGILKRSIAVLMHRLKSNSLADLDMGGPLLFTTLLSAVHLLVSITTLSSIFRKWFVCFGSGASVAADGQRSCLDVVSDLAGPRTHHTGRQAGHL